MTAESAAEAPHSQGWRGSRRRFWRCALVAARALQLALGIALLASCLPAVAVARRLATGQTKLAVIAAVRSAGELGTPQTASCLRVYISTVNSHWATMQFVYVPRCERLDGNGVAVIHRVDGRWRLVTAGSEFNCPMPGHIPRRVQADLRLYCVAH